MVRGTSVQTSVTRTSLYVNTVILYCTLSIKHINYTWTVIPVHTVIWCYILQPSWILHMDLLLNILTSCSAVQSETVRLFVFSVTQCWSFTNQRLSSSSSLCQYECMQAGKQSRCQLSSHQSLQPVDLRLPDSVIVIFLWRGVHHPAAVVTVTPGH